jgi:hypothetical protein
LVGCGVAHETIARVLKISVPTLKKYFGQELENGFEEIKARMGVALVRAGLSGNVAAMKFWLVTRGGPEWRIPKDDPAMLGGDAEEVVHFYMPPNGRDLPDTGIEPPTVDEELRAAHNAVSGQAAAGELVGDDGEL